MFKVVLHRDVREMGKSDTMARIPLGMMLDLEFVPFTGLTMLVHDGAFEVGNIEYLVSDGCFHCFEKKDVKWVENVEEYLKTIKNSNWVKLWN